MKSPIRQILIVMAVLATLVVNGLANALPINGVTTGEVSDSFDVLFVPAGYVFSIWGLIYLGLVGYALFQALPSQRDNPRLSAAATPFLIASASNIAWIFFWHYMIFPLTLVAMVLLLLSLAVIYTRLRASPAAVSPGERWLVRLPFSLYLAWVSVATIANAADVLSFYGWDGFGLNDAFWAVVMLIVGLFLPGLMSWGHQDSAFALVFIWAYAGIGVAQAQSSALVSTSAYLGAGVAGLLALLAIFQHRGNPHGERGPEPRPREPA